MALGNERKLGRRNPHQRDNDFDPAPRCMQSTTNPPRFMACGVDGLSIITLDLALPVKGCSAIFATLRFKEEMMFERERYICPGVFCQAPTPKFIVGR
jgi:hypothetical protein